MAKSPPFPPSLPNPEGSTPEIAPQRLAIHIQDAITPTTDQITSQDTHASHRVSRVAAGGLFALFFGSLIQALTLFGVITMNSGHIFMLIAFVAGALILTTEILPVKPRKHKVASVIILGVVLSGIDVASALYAARRERKAHAQSEALVASPKPTMTVTSSVSPSILSSPSPLKASSKAPAIITPRVSPNTKADERLVTEQSGVPIVTEQSGVPMTEEAETPWAIEVMVRPYGADEPLADANITIKNKRTNEQHSAVSGSDGHLALPLPVGEYKVTISKPGYRAVSRPCSITKKQGCYVVVGLEKE